MNRSESITNLLKAKAHFRALGVMVIADSQRGQHFGGGKSASEVSLIRAIQKPLIESGLEIVPIMKHTSEGFNIVEVTLFHVESGEYISSSVLIEPYEAKEDKNKNKLYLQKELSLTATFTLWSRKLILRLLGIAEYEEYEYNLRPEDLTISDEDKKASYLEYITQYHDKLKLDTSEIGKNTLRKFEEFAGDYTNRTLKDIENIVATIQRKLQGGVR
jgi:hypothetical protein